MSGAVSADTWSAWGSSWLAAALRRCAAAIEGLAEWLEAGEAARAVVAVEAEVAPLGGARERIAEALGRARSRYDAVAARANPVTPLSRTRKSPAK